MSQTLVFHALNPSYHLIYTILIICTVVYIFFLQQNAQNASLLYCSFGPCCCDKCNELTALYGKFLQLWRLEVCDQGASLKLGLVRASSLGLQAPPSCSVFTWQNMEWTE